MSARMLDDIMNRRQIDSIVVGDPLVGDPACRIAPSDLNLVRRAQLPAARGYVGVTRAAHDLDIARPCCDDVLVEVRASAFTFRPSLPTKTLPVPVNVMDAEPFRAPASTTDTAVVVQHGVSRALAENATACSDTRATRRATHLPLSRWSAAVDTQPAFLPFVTAFTAAFCAATMTGTATGLRAIVRMPTGRAEPRRFPALIANRTQALATRAIFFWIFKGHGR